MSVRARLAAALALAGFVVVGAPAGPVSASTEPTQRLLVTFTATPISTPSAASDRSVRAAAAALPADGSRIVRTYAHLPIVAVEATAAARQRLEAAPGVASVTPDRRLTAAAADEPAAVEAVATFATDAAATQPLDLPVATGDGWTVAVIDTGVDTNHPYIAGRTGAGTDGLGDGGACFADDCPPGPQSTASAQPCTVTGCEHGTHVAGIAVGDASKVSATGLNGMAPGAGLYPVRVFSTSTDPAVCGSAAPCSTAWESDVLAGLDHVAAEAAHYRFAAVNLSLGDSQTYPSPCPGNGLTEAAIVAAIGGLRNAGIAVVASAGNHGKTTGVSFPACADGAIAVAAQDATGNIASFSDTSTKVALAAPGTDIWSSLPGGAFGRKSGTSMAAPAVAGAFALVRQAAPAASLTSVLALLHSNVCTISDPRTGATYAALNVDAALRTLGYRSPHLSTGTAIDAFCGLPTPQRLVDTRTGAGGPRLPAGATIAITMPSGPFAPGASAAASLNVTAVNATAPGFLTVYPCDQPVPLVSSVNYVVAVPVTNKVIATVPGDGRVCIYTMSAADVVVDLDGWLPADQPFHADTPHRVLDTRQTSAPLTDVAVPVAPPGAVGAVVNVTVTAPAAAGYATVYPCGGAVPLVSNVNFVARATVPGAALVPVDDAGRLCVHTSTPAHVIVDVVGWLGSGFKAVAPFRAMDTRPLGTPVTDVVLGPGTSPSAAGVALTLTITEPTAAGYATVYPCGQPPPLVSNVNFGPGQTVANAVVATPDAQGRICVHTLVPTHVVVDISGSFE